jgi:hypothetical protein
MSGKNGRTQAGEYDVKTLKNPQVHEMDTIDDRQLDAWQHELESLERRSLSPTGTALAMSHMENAILRLIKEVKNLRAQIKGA